MAKKADKKDEQIEAEATTTEKTTPAKAKKSTTKAKKTTATKAATTKKTAAKAKSDTAKPKKVATKTTATTKKATTAKKTAPKRTTAKKEAPAEEKPAVPEKLAQRYHHGVGRRKKSIATVKLYNTPGKSEILVNDKPVKEVLDVDAWVKQSLRPLEVAELTDSVTIHARSYGGGKHGQAGALSLGIARALIDMNAELRPLMRKNGLLTRDSRMRESKKYGLKRARKAPQYTKR